MALRLTIDMDKCTACACCMMEAPGLFDIDDDTGQVVLLQEFPSEDQRDEAERGVRSCPENVITLHVV
ncbi:ferredoxin [Jatrophihabitans fulvus]